VSKAGSGGDPAKWNAGVHSFEDGPLQLPLRPVDLFAPVFHAFELSALCRVEFDRWASRWFGCVVAHSVSVGYQTLFVKELDLCLSE
jgi:hypothetical protein